ncbi:hypothetical protein [Enterobacter sp. 22452]|uniref:hypothetical protein n=1 Tax=Enterobacter TaxID=547 RepID=UPI003F856447
MSELLLFPKISLLINGCVLLREIQTKILLKEEVNYDDISRLRNLDKGFFNIFQVIIDEQNTAIYIPQRTLWLIGIVEKRLPELLQNMPLIREMSNRGIF